MRKRQLQCQENSMKDGKVGTLNTITVFSLLVWID